MGVGGEGGGAGLPDGPPPLLPSLPLPPLPLPDELESLDGRDTQPLGYSSAGLWQRSHAGPPKLLGQFWQELPVQLLRHLHVQPEFTLPVTLVAWPEQCCAAVHDWKQLG